MPRAFGEARSRYRSTFNSSNIQCGKQLMMYRQPSSVLLILTCIAAIEHAQSEQVTPGTIDLAFVGDIMLAETPGERISLGEDPFFEFAEVFRKVDFAIGNLECVVATTGGGIRQTIRRSQVGHT